MQGGSGFPLFLATAKGHSECVRLLTEAGATLDEAHNPLKHAAPFSASAASSESGSTHVSPAVTATPGGRAVSPCGMPGGHRGRARSNEGGSIPYRASRSPARVHGLVTGATAPALPPRGAAAPPPPTPLTTLPAQPPKPRGWLNGLLHKFAPPAGNNAAYATLAVETSEREEDSNSFMELDMISP
eukprot:3046187-Prymnesium_polylepis.1